MHESTTRTPPSRLKVGIAFLSVYLIWGSTYLAIRFAIATLPPLLMAGARFLVAGTILYVWGRRRGGPRPTLEHWRTAAIIGGMLLLCGNGGVVWAEQRVPSGLAALLIATVPLWMMLLGWLRGSAPPSGRGALGLLFGMAGVTLLVNPWGAAAGHGIDPLGATVLILAALVWAAGSLYARGAALPASPWLATGMEMLAGGALLLAAGFARGEGSSLDLGRVSLRSSLSLAYLVVFGALIGYTAYLWLLRVTTPSRASTYAFVNPLVAVLLGWALGGERISPRTLAAAGIIVAGVVLIVTPRRTAPAVRPPRSRTRIDTENPAGGSRPLSGLARPGRLDEIGWEVRGNLCPQGKCEAAPAHTVANRSGEGPGAAQRGTEA